MSVENIGVGPAGSMRPSSGGTLRMGSFGAAGVYLSSQRFSGTETVVMHLTGEEAVILGKYLTKLGRESQKQAAKLPRK